MKWRYWFNFTK